MNYTNKIRDDNDNSTNNYNINTLPEKKMYQTGGGRLFTGNNYRENTKYHFLNNLDNNTFNSFNRNINLGNNDNEEVYPLYNKKKMGLYKNTDEFNYLTNNNSKNKGKTIENIALKKYLNKIKDKKSNMK